MMTIHIQSLLLGFVLSWVSAGALLVVIVVIDMCREKKKRDRALDQLLAEVGIACLEQRIDVSEN